MSAATLLLLRLLVLLLVGQFMQSQHVSYL
jgi:hypothetical protein